MKELNDGVTYFENSPTIKTENGNIIIMDDTIFPINGMNLNDVISIYVVQSNKSNSPSIVYHNYGNPGQTFTIPSTDGYKTFCHIILPTQEYFESHEDVLYFATEDGKIFNSDDEEVSLTEVIEINSPLVIKHFHNFFVVEHLRKCYISLCLKIFNNRSFDKCFNGKIDSNLIYKRDLVWAALNVIQYMIDSNQFAEAQRLLERINGCNGLCSSENSGEPNCGCQS